MKTNFLENFYGVLFSPDKTFEELKNDPPIEQSFIIVAFISILGYLVSLNIPYSFQNIAMFGLTLIFLVFAGLSSWVFFAFFVELVAGIFFQSGKMRQFLTLSAFSLLPWIFLAPVELFKTAGIIGDLAGIIFGLLIWLWSTILIIVAVIKTYNLSLGRAIILMVIPFVGGFLSLNWIGGFFNTLSNILKV